MNDIHIHTDDAIIKYKILENELDLDGTLLFCKLAVDPP